VNDADWGIARNLVLVQISDGKIEEEWANAEKDGTKHKDAAFSIPGEDSKQPTVVRIPANLKDVNRIQATKIVNSTYAPNVLDAFLSSESREDVRLAIIAQKEKVMKPKRAI
jgi:hypothetical protein